MKGSVVKRGRQCDVTVTKTHLKCALKNSLGPDVFLEIPLSDILAVQTPSRDGPASSTTTCIGADASATHAAASRCTSAASTSSSSTTAAAADNNNHSVVVHYAGRRKDKKNLLTWEKLVLSGDAGLCSELNNICTYTMPGRQKPRQFLVLINPYGGRKTASRMFHKKVAPLFRACGVNFKVYETSGPKDARNAFRDVDFSFLDGVIVVGGDGFYSEVLTALVLRQQQLAGLSADDPDVEISQLPVPVGILPGGTGNYVVNYLLGTKDPITAAISILMGKTVTSNVVGVYQGGKLEGCAGLICAFGLFGEVMHECEKYRWMGNFRYKVIPIRSILGRRTISGRVEYLHAPSGEWREVTGQFYGFDLNVVDLVDNGEALVPTFGPDWNMLHLTSECPLGEHIKGLKKVDEWLTGAYDFPFIKNEPIHHVRVSLDSPASSLTSASTSGVSRSSTGSKVAEREVTAPTERDGEEVKADRPLEGVTYYVNLDGEAMPITRTQFQMKVHVNLVKLFCERSPR